MKRINSFFLVLVMAVSTGQLFAQFGIEEASFSSVVGAGARAFGMGGAFIAIADDATSASWNPGGLAQLEKPEVSVVFSMNTFDTKFPAEDPTNSGWRNVTSQGYRNSGLSIDFLSAAFPFRMGSVKFVPQLSYQRVINLGLEPDFTNAAESEFTFPDGTTEVFTNSRSGDLSGGFDVITGTLGLQISPKVHFGVTVNVWRNGQEGTSQFTRNSSRTIFIKSDTKTEISGLNFGAGLLIKPNEKINWGFTFRSSTTLDYEQTIIQTQDGYLDIPATTTTIADLEYPWALGSGIALRPTDRITVSADFTVSNWSKAFLTNGTRTEDGISVPVNDEAFPGNDGDEQENTTQIRLGAEYVFLSGQMIFPIRAGVFTNKQYITDGDDENISYLGFTVGAGIGVGGLLLDAAFVYQAGSSFIGDNAIGDRKFSSSQVFVSAIYRLDIL